MPEKESAMVTATTRFARIRRGASDPARSAEFYKWLLGLDARRTNEGFCLACANGEFIIHSDRSRPVAMDLHAENAEFDGHDPDGVPVLVTRYQAQSRAGSVALDHISLNCADLAAAIAFYGRLGFVITWSGTPPDYTNTFTGYQEEPLEDADWVHVSSADGYLALMQADWKDFGRHTSDSGPPRFIHVGFAVQNLDAIAARLDAAGVPSHRASRDSIGDRLYFNDPDGDERLGSNVELIEYQIGVARSGAPPY
jgi:catechol 2,3-dioxygenase-like lactoylglutathione lyase family enzyme